MVDQRTSGSAGSTSGSGISGSNSGSSSSTKRYSFSVVCEVTEQSEDGDRIFLVTRRLESREYNSLTDAAREFESWENDLNSVRKGNLEHATRRAA